MKDEDNNGAETAALNKKGRLSELAMQLRILTRTNWLRWREKMEDITYQENWPEGILNWESDGALKWDGSESAEGDSAEDKWKNKQRRLAYALVKMRVSDSLSYLLHGIKKGDVQEIIQKLKKVLTKNTEKQALKLANAFASQSMRSTGLNFTRFVPYILNYVNELKAVGEIVSDLKMKAVLIEGLLPEFTVIKSHIELSTQGTYTFESAVEAIDNFARDEGLLHLRK